MSSLPCPHRYATRLAAVWCWPQPVATGQQVCAIAVATTHLWWWIGPWWVAAACRLLLWRVSTLLGRVLLRVCALLGRVLWRVCALRGTHNTEGEHGVRERVIAGPRQDNPAAHELGHR